MLQLALHNFDLIVLVGVLVLVFLVTVVDVLVFVPLVAGNVGYVPHVVVHIQVVLISIVFVYCFPLSFLSPNVLLLLLLFVVPVNNQIVLGNGCHQLLQDYHWFCFVVNFWCTCGVLFCKFFGLWVGLL